MDADSKQDAPLPSLQIHLPSSSPGYSVPIRAPLTIDSDSEFGLSINDHIYSRTSSFNSSSSIDTSSYGDEHTSGFEEEHQHGAFVANPDEEIVIERSHVEESFFTRPFVRYADANYVKESSSFGESAIFRPSVKTSFEESSSTGDFGTKLSVPIAPLTRFHDSDSDSDYVDDCKSDGSRWIPADWVVQKVNMAPKVRSFNGDDDDDDEDDDDGIDDELQVEGVLSGDDITGIEDPNSMLTESIENSEIETETIYEKHSDLDEVSFDSERINAHIVSNSESEIDILNSVSTELIEDDGCKVECLNEVVKQSESDSSSFNLEIFDAQTVLSSNNEIETETIIMQLSDSDEPSFESEKTDAHIISNSVSEIDNLNYVSTESIEYSSERIDAKLSEADEPSFNSDTINAQIVSDLISEIKIKTANETEQEFAINKDEQMLKKMQQVRVKFLRLALSEQLTTKVNREGSNYNFDFNLTVLAIGKTGVGKSATINSIFGEKKVITHACDPGTTTIQEITGNVDGIQLRLIDTPGLKSSSIDRSYNLKILNSIKRFTRKHTPNVVLYVDRLDTRDVDDSQLLTLITSSLGSLVWHNCIIALTHASCESRDRLNEPTTGFMVQRRRFIQQQIVRCGGNTRCMANRVWLVDNQLSYEHDVMDLDCGLNGLACDPVIEPPDVMNRSLERNKGYFMEDGYRVKLIGNNHWSIGCRLCI